MSKRISEQLNSFKYKGEPVKVTLGTLLLICLCILLLIVATFTQLTLTHFYIPSDWFYFLNQSPTSSQIAQHSSKTYK